MSVFASTGTVSVAGSTTFNGPATLEIELSGTQTNEFDILSVSESATLGGTLKPHRVGLDRERNGAV
jgi:hypothetical protein